MLAQLRTAQALAARKPQAPSAVGANGVSGAGATPPKTDFANVFKNSLEQVNRVQQDAAQLSRNFSVGDPNTNLHDVMISMQKSSITFQQAVQVRNKLVQAYHEIMNMQV